ncbi:MAG: DegT/DnrJ/EryC1/StrS family aminotransferase [Lachnospiraceae bacterium]|nr:DegT/DnrJ/EryC1/StrS family aminotransferase [Lachnospiraceae bacterium]
MQFRDLRKQYETLKPEIEAGINQVLLATNFISGIQVSELEEQLAEYVGVKHCITCANGTDALSLALMAWGIGRGDAVFVPDFTFFSSGEVVSFAGATPIFVDVDEDTFNLNPVSLEEAIQKVLAEGILMPKAVVAVDLFGLPADYERIRPIVETYGLKLLEDGAQGFGGEIQGKKACSFGDISTTSFFPAKPLGCYGDGGALFTDDDSIADTLYSLRVHGKGTDKYDNIQIGMNSRLDTIQAAVLKVKLKAFKDYELRDVNQTARRYTEMLDTLVKTPKIPQGFLSSWAQYSILLKDKEERNRLQSFLKEKRIPSMIYYKKPMHVQKAFDGVDCKKGELKVTERICDRVLALPIHPYITEQEQGQVVDAIKEFMEERNKIMKYRN